MIDVGSLKLGTKVGFKNEGHVTDIGEVAAFNEINFTVQFRDASGWLSQDKVTYMYDTSYDFVIIKEAVEEAVKEVDCKICERKNYENAACCWWCGDKVFK